MAISWVPANVVPEGSTTVRCWLPDEPDRKLGGTWRLLDGAAGILDLASSFPARVVGKRAFSSYDIVHVESVGEVTKATLLGCHEIGSSGELGAGLDERAQTLEIETAMWGACLDASQLRFSHATFTTALLADWAFPGAFARFVTTYEEAASRADYKKPAAHEARLGDARLRIVADAQPVERGSSVEFDEEVTIHLSWDQPQPWDDVIRPISMRVADLISFATRLPNPPAALRMTGPALSNQYGDIAILGSVAVVDASIRPSVATYPTPERSIFQLRNAPAGWANLANAWIDIQDDVGVSLDLLTTLGTNLHETIYSAFFAAAQMLEGYHRARVGGKRIPHDEYRELSRRILEACPAEQKPWLSGVLMHGNDPSLRERIEDLIRRAGNVGKDMTRLRPQLSRDIVKYRNEYAHLLQPHATPAELELIDLVLASEWIMIGCVLGDLGWADSDRWQLLANHQAYSQATKPLVPIKPRPPVRPESP